MTFYEWAMTKRITNTPRGDFLQDMRSDESAAKVANSREDWEAHLRAYNACDSARVAFRSLWVSYCNRCGDPQENEAIIEQRTKSFFEMAAAQ